MPLPTPVATYSQLLNNAIWILNTINQAVLNGQHSINDSLSVRGEIVVLVTDVEVVVVCVEIQT